MAYVATRKPKSGQELVASLKALNLPAGYGDPNIRADELASSLRHMAETRQVFDSRGVDTSVLLPDEQAQSESMNE